MKWNECDECDECGRKFVWEKTQVILWHLYYRFPLVRLYKKIYRYFFPIPPPKVGSIMWMIQEAHKKGEKDIYLPPGIYKENIDLSDGIVLRGDEIKKD